MGNQRENNDELLFGLLSEKLYSHYCGTEEEQLKPEEEQAIIKMLNTLQVDDTDDFNPTEYFKRFCDKYITEEKFEKVGGTPQNLDRLIQEMEKDVQAEKVSEREDVVDRIWGAFRRTRVVRRVVFAVLIVAVLFSGMNLGTYATSKMGFFKFLSKNSKGFSFMVTGEELPPESLALESKDGDTYSSWEEVKKLKGMGRILMPQWLPEGYVLEEVSTNVGGGRVSYRGLYVFEQNKTIKIIVDKYDAKISWHTYVQSLECEYIENTIAGIDVLWYESEDGMTCFFMDNNFMYSVAGEVEKEVVEKIIENFS